ncbi:hypothetical protein J5Y09_03020 [Roseomonas sp. PWR1]|uniref:Uncharacterized protein n=1 Tax=Roseomonas nitratireducens TaxID=2820810 RepID=A0ABS4AND0_9PROT|nr:hypothetical protein [Neoroseomonas nitratireducens]MBP0462873.1 hypothetical protein [Neoroseomonas nitratireducens]
MSHAKHAARVIESDSGDHDDPSQAGHLVLASMALEGILLSAYEKRHDDAARVLADILGRLRQATDTIGRR